MGKIIAKWPEKGLHQTTGNEGQPQLTTPDASNVVPFDPQGKKLRGGQRPGLINTSDALPSGAAFAWLHGVPRPTDAARMYVATNNSNIYYAQGLGAAWTTAATALIPGGYTTCGSCDINGIVYFVNTPSAAANTTVYYNSNGNTCGTLASMVTTGTAPQGATICCNFRSRLCLAGVAGALQNIFMSRAGAPNDWDYSQQDSQAAVALNASASAGRVGEPVVALIPYRHDSMLIACSRSLFMMQGDPADGGAIITISDAIGVLSSTSWCIDEKGGAYLLTNAGLYRMSPEEGLVPVSVGRIDPYIADMIQKSNKQALVYDVARHAVWCLCTGPLVSQTYKPSLYYDVRTDSFWPQQFAIATCPATVALFDKGNSLVVGVNGTANLVTLSDTAFGDFGAAPPFGTYVTMGPHRLGEENEATVTGIEFYFGALDGVSGSRPLDPLTQFGVSYALQAAKDGWNATYNPDRLIGNTFTYPGRQTWEKKRLRGGSFVLKLFNNNPATTTWQFEQANIYFEVDGRQR